MVLFLITAPLFVVYLKVPSLIGPLVFLIYIDDLPASGLSSTPRLYADNACSTITSHDPTDLQINLNSDLNKSQSWLQANKLSLNTPYSKMAANKLFFCLHVN